MANAPLTYPLGGPTVSGTTWTVDFLLNDPKRVTRAIANLALQRFMVDRIFSPAGDITGGAVIYDQATSNDLYLTRDVERVEPGKDFPIVTADRPQPLTAQVEKFGGRFPVTDEARRRNQVGAVNRAIMKLANTIIRKVQQRALAELAAAITANSRTATGTGWTSAMALTGTTSSPGANPGRDFARVQANTTNAELGYEYDLMIVNPTQWESLVTIYGEPAGARPRWRPTASRTCGSPRGRRPGRRTSSRGGMVGELGYEVPLDTETWRDNQFQQNWYQSYVLPVVYVTDPFAILELTGLGA
jgi:hypothetical protein